MSAELNSVSLKILKIDSLARRAGLIFVAAAALAGAFFFAKWGFAYSAASRTDLIEIADLAVELGPDDPQTHFTAAVLFAKTFSAEDQQRSLAEFEKATALSPNNYLLWLELGKAREHSGDRIGAEGALRKALELAPNYAQVQWTLGNALLRQGKTDEAFAEIRKAAAGDPTYADAAASAAWQMLDGDITQVRKAIGDSKRMNAALASLLVGQKRFDEAFEIWNLIPADEKKSTFSETGEALFRQFIEAKKYRVAQRIGSQIGRDYLGEAMSNGGFEEALKPQNTDIFEWRIADGASPRIGPTTGQKHNGNYSFLISFGAESKDFRQVSQTIAVEPGKSYELELFYRADIKTTAVYKWEIVDASAGKVIASTNAIANTAEWTPLQAKFTVPENTDGVIIRLFRDNCEAANCAVSGNIWFDDFSLKAF